MSGESAPAGVETTPPGDSKESLRRIAAIAGYAGVLAALAFAFLCVMFDWFWTWWSITLFSLFGVAVIAGVALNFERAKDVFRTRRAAAGMSVALALVAGLVILVGVNYISFRRFVTWDITEEGRFTLSGDTRNLIEAVEKSGQPLKILSLLPPQASRGSGIPPRYPYLAKIKELLNLYEMSHSISVTITNPVGERNRTEAILKEIGLTLDTFPKDTIIFRHGDKRKDVKVSEMYLTFPSNPYSRQRQRPPIFKGEDAFTSAIRDILDDTVRKVYFVTGHGERTTGRKSGDYNGVAESLRGMNFKIDNVILASTGRVPEDTNVLVIAGPTDPIPTEELAFIESYLDGGGSLLVMLDLLDKRAGHVRSGLERLLKKYGIEIYRDVMAMDQRVLAGYRYTYGVPHEYHAISEPISRKRVLLRKACVMRTVSSEKPGLEAKPILQGTKDSWGETNPSGRLRYDKDSDIPGPTTLGVAVGPARNDPSAVFGAIGRAHIVAFADADLFSDRIMSDPGVAMAANTDLFLNSVNWIAGKTENIGIQPRSHERRLVHMTDVRRKRVFWGAVVLPALAMIILGIVVWRFRSS